MFQFFAHVRYIAHGNGNISNKNVIKWRRCNAYLSILPRLKVGFPGTEFGGHKFGGGNSGDKFGGHILNS